MNRKYVNKFFQHWAWFSFISRNKFSRQILSKIMNICSRSSSVIQLFSPFYLHSNDCLIDWFYLYRDTFHTEQVLIQEEPKCTMESEPKYLHREKGVSVSPPNAQRTAAWPTQHGAVAFKMSLLLEKVSKVMSCEIRAQAKKRLHVSHFTFIKNNICSVDLFIFHFLEKHRTYRPVHTTTEIHERSAAQLQG